LLHVKWNIIKAKQLGAKLVYKKNTHLTFPGASVEYYFSSWSDIVDIEDGDIIKNVHASLPTSDIIDNYIHPDYTSVVDMHCTIMRNIYKPSPRMQKIIYENAFLKSLPPSDTYIAMHVRWSDKIHGSNAETSYIALDEYVKHAISTRNNNPHIQTIVLCTDNTDALIHLESENNKLECPFTIQYNDQEERSNNNMHDAIVQKSIRNQVDQNRLVREYENGFVNFEIMIHSFCIIANFDSCYSLVPVQIRNKPERDINVQGVKPIWGFDF
jgi:hypothetical protein